MRGPALLSDVELLDSYPAAYASFAARQHRWVRGDWQIAAWLLPWTPSAHGLARNVLPPIARFKIFDNLRRSLVPPATIALLAAGWLGGYDRRRALVTTAYALLPLALPGMLDFGRSMFDRRDPQSTFEDLASSALRCGLNITFLPDQAVSNLDAIARTLARLLITRRDLLEWETAAEAHSRLTRSSGGLLRRMAPVAALGALAAVPWRATACQIMARRRAGGRQLAGRAGDRRVAGSAADQTGAPAGCSRPAAAAPARALHVGVLRAIRDCGCQRSRRPTTSRRARTR